MSKHFHYFREIKPGVHVDIYDVLNAFPTGSAAIDHAVKKLLCAGQRGIKDQEKDWREAIDSIKRAIELKYPATDADWTGADESRADVIGQNGNTGEHYKEAREVQEVLQQLKNSLAAVCRYPDIRTYLGTQIYDRCREALAAAERI